MSLQRPRSCSFPVVIGESPLGHESEFSFDLLDARRRLVPDDQTVGEMYATLKLAGYLRFNMTGKIGEQCE